MKCPNCNSENINFVSNITTKGYSNKNAAKGCFCFGLPGLLFGFCDSGKQQTREFWVCNNCGSKFQKADAYAKETRIQECREIISSGSKEELNNLLSYISKAKSDIEAAEEAFKKELESEKINNKDIVKANKTRRIKIIVAVVVGIVSLLLFTYEQNDLGTIFGIILLVLLITLNKSKEKIIDKYASAKLKELENKKHQAKEELKRLERIAKAQDDLQEMIGDEK